MSGCSKPIISTNYSSVLPVSEISSENINVSISDQTIADLPVYIQLLPNAGISLTRLFGVLAIYEFAYFTAPRSAQSLFMAICLISITMPDILPDALTKLTFDVSSTPHRSVSFLITAIIFSVHVGVCHANRSVLSSFLLVFS